MTTKPIKSRCPLWLTGALAAALLIPVSSLAQDESDSWQWNATIYGWLPDLEAATRFPSGADGPTIEVDAKDLIKNLDMTFMGVLSARKGSWGFLTDVIYLDEGASKNGTRDFNLGPESAPAGVTMDARLDLKSWVWTIAGTYSLLQSSNSSVDVLFGARMVDMKQRLDWTFNGDIGDTQLPGRSGSAKLSGKNWDAVMGLKGYRAFGRDERWVIPWYVDIGAGDSDFVWQAMAGLGYRFGWGTISLTYRHLDYDLDSKGALADLVMGGPMVGATFSW